jgi:signal transduction histidine kinase
MVVVDFATRPLPTEIEVSGAMRSRTSFAAEIRLLEMIASGYPLPAVAEELCRCVEPELSPSGRCAVSLIDWGGLKFHDVMAPNLPLSFHDAIRGQPVVCETGPCARAACLKSQVIAADMEWDPLWQFSGFRVLALAHGQRSCWSTPILSGSDEVLGTFAVLHEKPCFPTESQREIIAKASHIACIAIERSRRDALVARYEAFMVQTQALSATGSFAWRLGTDEINCSDELYCILGLERKPRVTSALFLSRVHPEDLPDLWALLERGRMDGSDIAHDFRLLMPDRGVRYVRMSARASRDSHGRPEYIGALQDLTRHHLCEDALREARVELAYAARVMSLGALSASIAHEIKQPLSGIITNAGTCLRMLASDPPDITGARETAKRTLRDGNRASDIITRLRALFTKKSVGGEIVDLNQVVQEALTIAASDLQCRRINVLTELSDEVATVRGDRIQLQQVILNLILNAADAMGSVDDRPRRLSICTQLNDANCAVLSVTDSGTGIGVHAARLFEPFYTTKSDGMGIGLSISHDIVTSHGGRLWAIPNEGPGATFCFSVPCARQPVCPASSVCPSQRSLSAPRLRLLQEPSTTEFGS